MTLQCCAADADQLLACMQAAIELSSMVMPHADLLLQLTGEEPLSDVGGLEGQVTLCMLVSDQQASPRISMIACLSHRSDS